MGRGKQREVDLAGLETAIRSGKSEIARRELKRLVGAKVSRNDIAPLAALASRAGIPMTGIHFLNPIVRCDRRVPTVPTPREQAEYAGCLIQIGALKEAELILEKLSPDGFPQALLFRAFAAIHQWEYGQAIAPLRTYARAPGLTGYQRLVGKANLAEAFIEEREFLKADALVRELLHTASERRLDLLLGKALELATQSHIEQRRYAKAREFIERAEKLVGETGTLDAFFVRKWKAILDYLTNKAPLDSIREEALHLKHWETVRDLDRIRAISTNDRNLLVHLYFGTPFRRFREKLGDLAPLPDSYTWQLKPGKGPTLDLVTIEPPLVFGQNEHRLLSVLASDFYRPFRIATLHGILYPGESFHPDQSAARAHNNVKLLRRWLEKVSLPLEVREDDGAYFLAATGPLSIRVGTTRTVPKKFEAVLALKARWPADPFSVGEASKELGISYRSAHRWLTAAASEGLVVCQGKGPATRYRFADGG